MGRLVVVTGTGTELGKTHLAVALVLAARARRIRVTGYKPIESGLARANEGDAHDLTEASSHPIAPSPLYAFVDPVSPHLAAARTSVTIESPRIVEAVRDAQSNADLVVVELAGGLFSPIGPSSDNATLLAELAPDATVLVAHDGLGVLHDVRAVLFAGPSRALPPMHLALVVPAQTDASTGHNIDVIAGAFVSAHVVPRGSREALAAGASVGALLDAVLVK